jgi:hypothetical protein
MKLRSLTSVHRTDSSRTRTEADLVELDQQRRRSGDGDFEPVGVDHDGLDQLLEASQAG